MTVISAIGQRGLSSRSHWRPASRARRDLESGLKSSAFRRGLIEAWGWVSTPTEKCPPLGRKRRSKIDLLGPLVIRLLRLVPG